MYGRKYSTSLHFRINSKFESTISLHFRIISKFESTTSLHFKIISKFESTTSLYFRIISKFESMLVMELKLCWPENAYNELCYTAKLKGLNQVACL